MIVKCIRCNTEFDSPHSESHSCPNCHLVFRLDDRPGSSRVDIVRSSDLAQQEAGHRLSEEVQEKCAFHHDVDAIDHCTRCGRPVCYACTVETERGTFCEPCSEGAPMPATWERDPGPVPEPPAEQEVKAEKAPRRSVSQAMAAQPYVAWEHRAHLGRLNALFITWRQTLFRPLRFFHSVPLTGSYRNPLLYGVCWTLIWLAGGGMWRLLSIMYPTIMEFIEGQPVQIFFQLSRTYAVVLAGLLLSPLFAAMLLLIPCVVYHVFVLLFTRKHAGFEATLRVVCYSTGAGVFCLLPMLGVIIGGLWQLVLITLGLKEVHRISFARVIVVTLVPNALLLGAGVLFMLWAIGGLNIGL